MIQTIVARQPNMYGLISNIKLDSNPATGHCSYDPLLPYNSNQWLPIISDLVLETCKQRWISQPLMQI